MRHRKKALILGLLVLSMVTLGGCKNKSGTDSSLNGYHKISQEEAKEGLQREDGHVLVDVRREDEYEAGHIPGAILIPNETIAEDPPKELPDLDQIVYIYCRSGNRSRQASEKLVKMGYTRVYDFGGILDWTGEIVSSENPS